MAANYKVNGLLFVFMICFNHSYMLITFKEEPKTDKSCYVPNDNGILTTAVSVLDPSVPLDRYTIAWNTNQDGTGTWLINGSECLIYQGSGDHYIQNLRWKATFVYDHRSLFYTIEVKDMKLHDLTPGLYALVIDSKNDLIVASSSGTASFNVELDCPLPIPTNKIPPNTKEISASPTRTSIAAPSSSLGGYKMDSSSSYSTPALSSSPPPPVEGYLSQEWNKLTSHLEEIKKNVNLIPVSKNVTSWTTCMYMLCSLIRPGEIARCKVLFCQNYFPKQILVQNEMKNVRRRKFFNSANTFRHFFKESLQEVLK